MATNAKRIPFHATAAADGSPVVYVTLANYPFPAVLDAADFARLVELGVSLSWCFNWGRPGMRYVRCPMGGQVGNLVTVARMILAAPRGRVVSYRDGDRTNLRRANLVLKDGPRAKGWEATAMAELSHAALGRDLAERLAAE